LDRLGAACVIAVLSPIGCDKSAGPVEHPNDAEAVAAANPRDNESGTGDATSQCNRMEGPSGPSVSSGACYSTRAEERALKRDVAWLAKELRLARRTALGGGVDSESGRPDWNPFIPAHLRPSGFIQSLRTIPCDGEPEHAVVLAASRTWDWLDSPSVPGDGLARLRARTDSVMSAWPCEGVAE
jgi:hypothetical protein